MTTTQTETWEQFKNRKLAQRDARIAREARQAKLDRDPAIRLRSHMMNRPLGVTRAQWILAPF
jgi:hypothetical protein